MFRLLVRLAPVVTAVMALSACVGVADAADESAGAAPVGVSDASADGLALPAGLALPDGLPLLPGRIHVAEAHLVAEDGHNPQARWLVWVYCGSANWEFDARARLLAARFSSAEPNRPLSASDNEVSMTRGDLSVHVWRSGRRSVMVVYTITQRLGSSDAG